MESRRKGSKPLESLMVLIAKACFISKEPENQLHLFEPISDSESKPNFKGVGSFEGRFDDRSWLDSHSLPMGETTIESLDNIRRPKLNHSSPNG